MWFFKNCISILSIAVLVSCDSDFFGARGRNGRHNHNHNHRSQGRRGRQNSDLDLPEPVQGGVDFSGCEMQDDGMCCVMREEEVTTLQKDPILECTHKSVEKCHYTYATEFFPVQEEICEENYEKNCQITFKKMAVTETIKKCYRPLIKTCGENASPRLLRFKRQKRQLSEYGGPDSRDDSLGEGAEEQCKTFYETACTTKYVEKQPGKFVGDTKCEKLPVELCGVGCKVEEGEEECHDKEIDTLVDVPEEQCDLNPQTTCRFQTKLVPRLKPKHECTVIPQEVCQLKFDTPRQEVVPFMSKWCIDPNEEVVPDSTYDETQGDEPLGLDDTEYEDYSESEPEQLYGAPALGEYAPPEEAADEDYSSDDYEEAVDEDFSIDDYEDLLPPPEAVRSTLEKELFPDSKI